MKFLINIVHIDLQVIGMMNSIDKPQHALYSSPLLPISPPWPPHGTRPLFVSAVVTFLFSGMVMTKYILHVKDSIAEMLQLSSTARCTVRSTMVISWVFCIMLFSQYILTMHYVDYLTKVKEAVFRDHIRNVLNGNLMYIKVQFALYAGTSILIELPILMILFKRIFAQISKDDKIQYLPMHQKMLKILNKFSYIFGFIGIVFYVQIQTVYLFHAIILFLIIPVTTVVILATQLIFQIIFIFIFTRLQLVFIKKTRGCSIKSLFMALLLLTGGFLMMAFLQLLSTLYGISYKLSDSTLNTTGRILTSIISSFVLAVAGLIFKQRIYQRVKVEVASARTKQREENLIEL